MSFFVGLMWVFLMFIALMDALSQGERDDEIQGPFED